MRGIQKLDITSGDAVQACSVFGVGADAESQRTSSLEHGNTSSSTSQLDHEEECVFFCGVTLAEEQLDGMLLLR